MDNPALYRQLFLQDTPFIDLRAPAEFAKGAFPTSASLPLMTDDERAKVGTCYKHHGQQAAINLGHRLVSGPIKDARVQVWSGFARANPQGYLYCWRGGLRSQITQQWLQEAGIHYPRVPGGYKALRRFLIDELERLISQRDFVLLAGRTGSGKTQLLNALPGTLDLEGLANHRGSSFGARLAGQPTQIAFENALAIALLKLESTGHRQILLEDESAHIGSLMLPASLRDKMRQAPVLILETPLAERIAAIHREYVQERLAECRRHDREQPFARFSRVLQDSLFRIRKRLGGEAYQRLSACMQAALDYQSRTGDDTLHLNWIRDLLVDYYDPMYDYQLTRRPRNVLRQGSGQSIRQAWKSGCAVPIEIK
ncbi:tRNA 2-selenouridine(34) synthase MnmH [Bowmanella dokdonensis]|uniref:tRNA 2-selenouridine(34) synthase MnmH n=1 Tax=Bowmanella dokdonensis TaxID=751969 RepID=UPI0030B9BBDB